MHALRLPACFPLLYLICKAAACSAAALTRKYHLKIVSILYGSIEGVYRYTCIGAENIGRNILVFLVELRRIDIFACCLVVSVAVSLVLFSFHFYHLTDIICRDFFIIVVKKCKIS